MIPVAPAPPMFLICSAMLNCSPGLITLSLPSVAVVRLWTRSATAAKASAKLRVFHCTAPLAPAGPLIWFEPQTTSVAVGSGVTPA